MSRHGIFALLYKEIIWSSSALVILRMDWIDFFHILLMTLLCWFPQDEGPHFSVGSKLLSVVYKGIAPGGERVSLPSLDISSKRLADSLLQLAFAIDEQVGCGSPVTILKIK